LDPNSRAARAAQIVGGQYAIRHADIERDLPFVQKRFMEAYADLTDVDSVREALPQIAVMDEPKRLSNSGFARIGIPAGVRQ
jgi:hypothetical protein